MKIDQIISEQFLTERATDIVYHYTGIQNAYRILESGKFLLANTSGTKAELEYAPKGYPYFLSTSRSKTGDYHRYVGSGGAMFVLDGQWLSARYPVKPVDYWYSGKKPQTLKKGEWQTIEPEYKRPMYASSPDRGRETEDRVFSRDNSISIDCVKEIHLLMKEQDDRRSRWARRIMILAKKRKIPTYLYTSEDAWRLQDTRNTVQPSQIKDILKSTEKERHYAQRPVRGLGASEYGRSNILNWIELIQKRPGQPLSKQADKLRYNLLWYGDTHSALENDIHNARKPDSNEYDIGVRLSDYMTKNNLSASTLQKMLQDKWRNKPSSTVSEHTSDDFLYEGFPYKNKNKIYSLMIDTIDSGPFDGGCVVFAKALQIRFGGDIVVLVGKAQRGIENESAQHAALLLNGKLVDADGPMPPKQFIERFTENELAHVGGYISGIRPIKSDDLPEAPRNPELSAKIASLLASSKKETTSGISS